MKGDDERNSRISSLGSPERHHHEDEDAFGMTNSEDDEDETTASRDDIPFVIACQNSQL